MKIKEAGENTIVCQFTEDELESMGYDIEDIEEDDDLKEEFLEECQKRSLYDTGITAEYGDELLTLSTCEYSHENGRFVAVAKRIREED